MQREHVAVGKTRLLNNIRSCILGAPYGSIEAIYQRVKLLWSEFVEASEIGDNPDTYLPRVVPEGLDEL